MKISTDNLAALSLVAVIALTAACSISNNFPTGPTPSSLGQSSTLVSPDGTGVAPVLRSAGEFMALSGSTLTNTSPTGVTGDQDARPVTAMADFLPGIVESTIHAGASAAAQAQLDLTAAYNDAAGRTIGAVLPVKPAENHASIAAVGRFEIHRQLRAFALNRAGYDRTHTELA